MKIQVIRPGAFTTVQDAGRFGSQAFGIGPGGAMDPLALRVANHLVGNEPAAAALEITLTGPVLRFDHDGVLAISGGHFAATIGGDALPHGRAIFVRAGTELNLGAAMRGSRAIVAIAGGIDVALVLGSRSTNQRAHFGGLDGRAIRAGDQLPVGPRSTEANALMTHLAAPGRQWSADRTGFAHEFSGVPATRPPLRLITGAGYPELAEESKAALDTQPFRVSPRSDRMGYRLDGPVLALGSRREMTSEGVTWGTVQLPPDGQPIILLADRQTTGGYPVIGHVASADRALVANAAPGDEIRFMTTTLPAARQALLDQEQALAAAAAALHAQRASTIQ